MKIAETVRSVSATFEFAPCSVRLGLHQAAVDAISHLASGLPQMLQHPTQCSFCLSQTLISCQCANQHWVLHTFCCFRDADLVEMGPVWAGWVGVEGFSRGSKKGKQSKVLSLGCMQIGMPSLGRMPTIREPEGASLPLVAILDEEGQMTGITCPLNVGVDPHDIEGCEDLLESYFMQVLYTCCVESMSSVPDKSALCMQSDFRMQ